MSKKVSQTPKDKAFFKLVRATVRLREAQQKFEAAKSEYLSHWKKILTDSPGV